MMKTYNCKIFKVNEDNGNLWPVSKKTTDEIAKDYQMDIITHKFMIEELKETGRYWINDEIVIGIDNV